MRVQVAKLDVPYYALHNHASNSILSPEDIEQLIKHKNMCGIGAYGNGGALDTCEKVYGYNAEKADNWYAKLVNKYPLYRVGTNEGLAQRIEFALELRKDGAKFGLHFN